MAADAISLHGPLMTSALMGAVDRHRRFGCLLVPGPSSGKNQQAMHPNQYRLDTYILGRVALETIRPTVGRKLALARPSYTRLAMACNGL